jgi:histidinol-phosphate aminotransferase
MKSRKILKDLKPYTPGKFVQGTVKLASNENQLGCSPKVLKVLKEIQNQIPVYPEGSSLELRQKLAEGWGLKTDNFVVGAGSDQILMLIAQAYLEPGDEVVISETTFSQYEFSAQLAGATIKKVATTAYNQYDLDAFEKAITAKTKIIYLCSPNNPTGLIISDEKLQKFLKVVPGAVMVVLDEAYAEYVESKMYHNSRSILAKYSNVILLRTFSKAYGLAGLRVGYGVASIDIVGELMKVKEPFNVGRISQMAALGALTDKAFLLKSQKNNKMAKKYMYSALEKLGLHFYPSEANFIYIEVPIPAREFADQIEKKGMTIRPLDSFGKPHAIRVTLGTPAQNELFVDLLKKILKKKS